MMLHKNENLTIEYSQEGEYLVTSWNGFTSYETFAEGIDQIMTYFYEKKARGLLIDTTQHKGVEPKGQQYAAAQLNDYMRLYGAVNQAIVVSKDVFARFSVKNFTKQLAANEGIFQQKYFDNLQEAKKWLVDVRKEQLAS
jgi:hypothetical protein